MKGFVVCMVLGVVVALLALGGCALLCGWVDALPPLGPMVSAG